MVSATSLLITYRLNNGRRVIDPTRKAKIYIRVRAGRKLDFKASTHLAVLPKYWDESKNHLKQRFVFAERALIENTLTALKNHIIEEAVQRDLKKKPLTYKAIKQILNSFYEATQENKELFEFIKWYLDKAKTTPNPTTGKPITKATLAQQKTTFSTLKRFSKEVYTLHFENLDLEFYTDFVEWMQKLGYSQNYIGKNIKDIKVFMQEALEQGLTDNEEFKKKRFKVLREEVENIYLTIEELEKIEALSLPKGSDLRKARDLFLIGAHTGLRFSDTSKLTKDNITSLEGKPMLTVRTQKTNQKVNIPLHPTIKKILRQYENEPLPTLPLSKLNEMIKEVGKRAEIQGDATTSRTEGGKRITTRIAKYELITSHTARRSFCTNAYISKMPTLDIMAISGHTTEASFMKYIKITSEQRALKIAGHEYFNEPKMKVAR